MVDILGINSIRGLCYACKSIIKRYFRRNKSSSSTKHNQTRQNQTQQGHVEDNKKDAMDNGDTVMDDDDDDDRMMSLRIGCCLCSRHRSLEASRSRKTRSESRESGPILYSTPTPTRTPSSWISSGSFKMNPNLQSKDASCSRRSGPILYSNSSGMLKPPPIEKMLECTLEDLCYGCKKKVMITRDVLNDAGEIVLEEEILTIDVQPGWRKGTKITFEGKGNERPGLCREDIIILISEKGHQLFRREGDDLELCVVIPLLQALTGCTISIPLLGGEHMNLTVDDIIHPGYQNIIIGQGMPISRESGKRGDLRITFLVEFPTHLTDEQRSEVFCILQNSC